jgi:hypothetical protein
MMSTSEQRRLVNHAWTTSFAKYAQAPQITMAKNSTSMRMPFTLPGVVSQKPWMIAWKRNVFDELLQFDTSNLANDDQDLYREITSYTWSELNDATRDLMETKYGFLGNEKVQGDNGTIVPTSRANLAMQRLADDIKKKTLEIVSKEAFTSFFMSNRFTSRRKQWNERVEKARRAKNVKAVEAVAQPPSVVIGVPTNISQSVHANLANVVASAASAAVSSAASAATSSSANVSVTVAVASVSSVSPSYTDSPKAATPVPAPVAAPPPSPRPQPVVHELDDDEMQQEAPAAESMYSTPSTQTTAEGVQQEDVSISDATPISEDMLKDHFSKTSEWSHRGVGPEKLEATRVVIEGFQFYSKYRATASAKTKGQRDSYCGIVKGSRAERWCNAAGISLKKKSDSTLRSKKDIERFWAKLAGAGIDLRSIV